MSQKVYRRFEKHSQWLLSQPGVHAAAPEGRQIVVFIDVTVNETAQAAIKQQIGDVPVYFVTTVGFQAELESPVPVELGRNFGL